MCFGKTNHLVQEYMLREKRQEETVGSYVSYRSTCCERGGRKKQLVAMSPTGVHVAREEAGRNSW